jgi:hypothetical protein
MATSFPWMEAAYQSAMTRPVNSDQYNPDWGAMKDTLQVDTAGKYVDWNLTADLMNRATDSEARLMTLDTANTQNLMATEYGLRSEGMKLSNELSKDYLKAETASDVIKIGATGTAQQGVQEVVNEGMWGSEAIRGEATKYTADRSLDSTKVSADANKYLADQQARASIYGSDSMVKATDITATGGVAEASIGADASKYGSKEAAEAQKFVATEGAGAQKFSATEMAGAQKYASNQEAGASRYASDAAVTQADIGAGASRYASDAGVRQAEIGSATSRYSEDSGTTRTRETLASNERSIGLSGQEQRGIVETQGSESRKGIAAEGEEARRNLAYDRAMSYRMAREGARRG